MKGIFVFVPILLAAVPCAALADQAPAPQANVCINPHFSYISRALNAHDVFVQNSIGTPRPPVRLKTSCIDLDPAIGIRIGSSYNCIGRGDQVTAATVDGHVETCRVTAVLPYAPQEGDKPQRQ